MSEEIWKPIEGFVGLYEVSSWGNVKALERQVINNGGLQWKHERILKQNKGRGANLVVLCKEGKTYSKSVHRLVAMAFIPNPENKPVIDHIDTNPRNNHVENLRWVTQKENCLNPLTRIHNSESKKGLKRKSKPRTPEQRLRMSLAKKGKPLSEAHKQALRKAKRKKEGVQNDIKELVI